MEVGYVSKRQEIVEGHHKFFNAARKSRSRRLGILLAPTQKCVLPSLVKMDVLLNSKTYKLTKMKSNIKTNQGRRLLTWDTRKTNGGIKTFLEILTLPL